MPDKPKIFSFKPQSQWGKAVGLGLALNGVVGGVMHGAPKAKERIERYEHRRDHDERHERFQAARRQLIEQALVELREGRYRSGRFIIRANALDLREAGLFPEATTVEAIETRYQHILARFQSRLSQHARPYTIEQISEALVEATEGFDYQGVAGREMLLLLVEGTGSCDQIAQFVASLLNDAGLGETGLRAYPNHTAPTLLVRSGTEVRAFDMSAAGPVFPYGVEIPIRDLPTLYRRYHFSEPSPVGGVAGAWNAWSVERHPADARRDSQTDILDVGSFQYPLPSPEMDQSFPSDVIPFYASNIVNLYSTRANGLPQSIASGRDENSLDCADDAYLRHDSLSASTEVIFGQYTQAVLELGRAAEYDGYQAVDVFQPFSRREMQLLSQHIDYLTLEVQRAPTERERLAWRVQLGVVYKMAALQSQVMGRRQAQSLAQRKIQELIEQIRPFFVSRSLTEQVELMWHGSPQVPIEYVLELLPEYQQGWADELLRIASAERSGLRSGNRLDAERLLLMLARVARSIASDRRMELLGHIEGRLPPFRFAEFLDVFERTNTQYGYRVGQRNQYQTLDWDWDAYSGHTEIVGESALAGRLRWRRAFLSERNIDRIAGYKYDAPVSGAYRRFDDIRADVAEYALQNRLSIQESRWLLLDAVTVIHSRMFFGNIASRFHNRMMVRSYTLLREALHDTSWLEWPEARGYRETLTRHLQEFQSQLPEIQGAIQAEAMRQ